MKFFFKPIGVGSFLLLYSCFSLAGAASGNCRNDSLNGACGVNRAPCIGGKPSAFSFVKTTDAEKLTEVGSMIAFWKQTHLGVGLEIEKYAKELQVCVVDYDLDSKHGSDFNYHTKSSNFEEELPPRISLWMKSPISIEEGKGPDRLFLNKHDFYNNSTLEGRTAAIFSKIMMRFFISVDDSQRLKDIFSETSYYSNLYLNQYKLSDLSATSNLRQLMREIGIGTDQYVRLDHLKEFIKNRNWDLAHDYISRFPNSLSHRQIGLDESHVTTNLDELEQFLDELQEFSSSIQREFIFHYSAGFSDGDFLNLFKGRILELIHFLKTIRFAKEIYDLKMWPNSTDAPRVINIFAYIFLHVASSHEERIQFIEEFLSVEEGNANSLDKRLTKWNKRKIFLGELGWAVKQSGIKHAEEYEKLLEDLSSYPLSLLR